MRGKRENETDTVYETQIDKRVSDKQNRKLMLECRGKREREIDKQKVRENERTRRIE